MILTVVLQMTSLLGHRIFARDNLVPDFIAIYAD